MMKGMFKRALGVVAAAAMAVTGMAALTGTANAAEETLYRGNATVEFTATDAAQLQDRTLHAYKIGDYYVKNDDNDCEQYFRVQTVNGLKDVVRDAWNKVLGDDEQISGTEDPLAEIMSREETEIKLGDINASYDGLTRQFVQELVEADLGTPTVISNDEDMQDAHVDLVVSGNSATASLEAGVWVIFDHSDANQSVPMVIATEHTATSQPSCSVSDTATINMKNETQPDQPTKEVTGGTNGTVSFGDELEFTITDEDVPDVHNYTDYTYTVTDTPSLGLTVDLTSIKINGLTIGELNVGEDETRSTATVSPEGDEFVGGDVENPSFTVTLNINALKQVLMVNGSKIVVTYKATVNTSAPVTGVNNSATVSHNGNPSGAGTSETLHYNSFQFNKVYADNTPAPNAEFIVSYVENETTYYLVTAQDGTWATTTVRDEAEKFTPVDGVVSLTGLKNGTYTVEEVKQADQAMRLMPSFTVKLEYGQANVFNDLSDAWDLFDPVTATVTNVKSVTQLPMTGAAGITMFVVLGLLIVGAGVTVYMKSRGVRNAMRA